MTNAEVEFIMDAIEKTASQFHVWMNDYEYNPRSNEYSFIGTIVSGLEKIESWFTI